MAIASDGAIAAPVTGKDSGVAADANSEIDDVTGDPLLDCLEHLVRYHERATSRTALVAGLPLEEGRLTPKHLPDAAERAGMSAKIVKRRLKQLSSLLLPAIILLKNGSCVVLQKRNRFKSEVFIPDSGGGYEKIRNRDLEREYAGYAILVKPQYRPMSAEDRESPSKNNKNWFWGTVSQFWPSYVQVLLAAALVNVLGIAAPLFIMNVYDRVLPNKALTTLWVLAIGIIAAIVFDFLFRSLRNALIGQAAQKADVRLASKLFEHILKIESAGRPARTGEFANKVRDYEVVREFFTSNTVVTLTDLAFVGLYIFIIYQIAGIIAIVPAAAVLHVLLVGLVIQYPLAKSVRTAQSDASHRHSILFEAINGIDTIKSCRAEGQMQRQWEQFVSQNARTSHKMRSISAFGMNFTALIQQLVTVAIVIMGVHLFDQGEITPGALIAAVILAGRGVAPLGQLASTLARAQQAFQSLRTLNEIMATPSEGDEQVRHIDKPVESGRIVFDNVTFSYPDAPAPALDQLSFTIEPGERVGLIGKIGSGKTSIGRLLGRLYVPADGNLILDGVDIRQYHPSEIRKAVVFSSQDSTLFSGTIRDNIALGTSQVADEAIVRAAELAGIGDFVRNHPNGFNMQVGEAGRQLSSGQRQSVVLARAFLFEPKVVFLDEPTGMMDMASERSFVDNLASALQPDQTLILATHRQRPLDIVNRLIVIDGGRLIADGPRDEILQRLSNRRQAAE